MKNEATPNVKELLFKVPDFEGPLDLLLHLIKKNQMDIYDIPMAEITTQYIDYLHQLKEMQLDIAGEYLVTASMLVNIKSKMLLPNEQASLQTDDEVEDPRESLVQQLLLHQTFQTAAQNMRGYADERMKLYPREQALVPAGASLGKLDPDSCDITALQKAFARLMLKRKAQKPVMRKIESERYFLKDQITRVEKLVKQAKEPIEFEDLFAANAALELVVTTFLALLELVKQGAIRATQEDVLGPIKLVSGEVNAV